MLDYFAWVLHIFKIPSFVRRMFFSEGIVFLVYHNPKPEIFDKHISFIKNYCNICSIDEAVSALRKNQVSSLGVCPVVITIDDGLRENYQLLPVIRKHNIRPIMYLCAGVVGTKRSLWDYVVVKQKPSRLCELKRLSEKERRAILRSEFNFDYTDESSERMCLSQDELRIMSPWVDFGSHGMFHQPLTFLELDVLEREIYESKERIESLTGQPCRHFSFPSGFYNDQVLQAIQEAGYASARSTRVGVNHNASSLFHLYVTGASDDASQAKLDAQLSGLFRFVKQFPQRMNIKRYPCNGI